MTRLYTYLLVFAKRSISLIILCKIGEIDIYFTESVEIDNSLVKVYCLYKAWLSEIENTINII